jgi:hypothetical protein
MLLILETFVLKKPFFICRLFLLLASVLCFPHVVFAQAISVDSQGQSAQQTLNLPFAFYNENFGFTAAYVYGLVGFPQKQAALMTTVMIGTKGSAMGFLIGRDIQMPGVSRLFLDPIISIGYFSDIESYIDGNPDFPDERAGSNDSDEDNFVDGDGWDNFARLKFKYLLPIGNGKEQIISTYTIERGLLTSGAAGGHAWHPLASGKTYLELRPFWRSQQIDGDDIDDDIKTNGLDFSIFWDNRDFPATPSKGNSLRVKMSRDFGWFDSSDDWTNIEGELDVYIPLHLSDGFRQTVLALDIWTSFSPTWDRQENGAVENRPPAYTGSTLGGAWRLRGFPTKRFNDKAAIYYAAEFRMIPQWNPFEKWPRIQKFLGIQWLQFVPLFEIGRVASEWKIGRLHADMKWNAGLGIRAMAKGIVIRVDTVVSDEQIGVQMMISQPFQF